MSTENLIRDLLAGRLYYTRRSAAKQLAGVVPGSPRIVAALVVAQEDEHPFVREAATLALQAPQHRKILLDRGAAVHPITQQLRETRPEPVRLMSFREVHRQEIRERLRSFLLLALVPTLYHLLHWMGIEVPLLVGYLVWLLGVGLIVYGDVRRLGKVGVSRALRLVVDSALLAWVGWWAFSGVEGYYYLFIYAAGGLVVALLDSPYT